MKYVSMVVIWVCINFSWQQVRAFNVHLAHWKTNGQSVPYCRALNYSNIGQRESSFAQAIDLAVSSWQAECADYSSRLDFCNQEPTYGLDHTNWIFWLQDYEQLPGVDPNSLALTMIWSVGDQILDADIVLNDEEIWDTNGTYTDVQSIITHEYGHLLGLRHPEEIDYPTGIIDDCENEVPQPAVMCMQYKGGQVHQLTEDDIAGLCYLYPKAGYTGSTCTSDEDCNSDCVAIDNESFCSTSCDYDFDCGLGYVCHQELHKCQPMFSGNTQCLSCGNMVCGPSSICVNDSLQVMQSSCVNLCNSIHDCPYGFDCLSVDDEQTVCWPLGGSCQITAQGVGSDCSETRECSLGSICLYTDENNEQARCFRLCQDNIDCGQEQLCTSLTSNVSFCEDLGLDGCRCDVDTNCNATCACDLDCIRCDCDQYNDCNTDCQCDNECCACDSNQMCQTDCQCDPDCGCQCDIDSSCSVLCYCDYDCHTGIMPNANNCDDCNNGCGCTNSSSHVFNSLLFLVFLVIIGIEGKKHERSPTAKKE